jgi:hypothetical protein
MLAKERLLSFEEWEERGCLENQLESIYQLENIHWT